MRVWLLQIAEPMPHDNDGAQRLLRTGILAKNLIRAGHTVTWWTSTFDHFNRKQRHEGNRLVPVEPGYDVQYLCGPAYHRNISFKRFQHHRAVARQFDAVAESADQKPDIVLASVPTTELAASAVRFGRRHRIPVILDIRDLWPDVFFDVLPGIMKPLINLVVAPMRRDLRSATCNATAIIGLTDGFVEWGLRHAGRTRRPQDRVFFMGYTKKARPPADCATAASYWDDLGVGLDPDTLTVAFVGTLGFMFDFDPVLAAARELHEAAVPVRFVVCGDGARRKQIEAQAAGLPNVLFPGWVTEDLIQGLFERSSIGLTPYIPSQNFILNLPNKPAEYMAGGLCIAHSLDKGELFNLLSTRDCGFSYGQDGRALAKQLKRLVEDPVRLAGLRARAKEAFSVLLEGESVYGEMVRYLEGVAGA
jgi:glycosyltransferase involved in cell wall biosynthesis